MFNRRKVQEYEYKIAEQNEEIGVLQRRVENLTKAFAQTPRIHRPIPGDPTKIKFYENSTQGIFSGQESLVLGILTINKYSEIKSVRDIYAGAIKYVICEVLGNLCIVELSSNNFDTVETVSYPKENDNGEDL